VAASHADRRVTAILAADVVGFSRLMERDEDGTLARLKAHRKELAEPLIAEYRGRTVKLMGDGALCEFASVVDAVRCAIQIQHDVTERERETPDADRIRFRIGINLGDVIHEDDGDLYGDGVNVAARLEPLADPGGIVVSGTAFDQLQGKLDLPLDFLGERQLKNIARPVRAYRVRIDGPPPRRLRRSRRAWILASAVLVLFVAVAGVSWLWPFAPLAPQKPSLVVLPFVNNSSDADLEYLADGITDDLITDLAQLSGLLVIARNSAFSYKGRAHPVQEIGHELGVRYVLEGSVRRTAERLRVNAQLIDAATGASLWADGFDRKAGDMPKVENEMIRQTVATLSLELSPSERARLERPPTDNLAAYDNFLRAERAARSGRQDELRDALALYARAADLDPNFAEALAGQARTAAYVWSNDYDETLAAPVARREAFELASRAAKLDPDAPLPYAVLAVLQVGNRQYEEAIASARRAVALGPSDADAHSALGAVLTFAGEHAEAARAADEALRLDPVPATGDGIAAGLAYSLAGHNERAIEVLEAARKGAPLVENAWLVLAVAYARAGRMAEARAAAQESLRLEPRQNIEVYRIILGHFRRPEDLAAILEALAAAGIPRWPFGASGEGLQSLDRDEITRLVDGRTWQGSEREEPAIFQFGPNGQSAYRTTSKLELGTAFVEGNLLCDQSDSTLLGRPRCGPIYRLPPSDEPGAAYLYLNAHKVLRFSVAD
jgi:adenylate cyclase